MGSYGRSRHLACGPRRAVHAAGAKPENPPRAGGSIVGMKKLADYGRDDHPEGDPDRSQAAWTVAALDDCDLCADVRIELTLEEVGRPGAGVVAHLAPRTAKQLMAALRLALRDIGEDPGP